ncbi:MAG TPA: tRNA guanosine(34) transglycosylase Tgt [Polyangiaceae bacterium]|nr:tRNA guanosine(34) transglycosylase Tgt [Polyangiaceae bacterium]
MIRFRVEATSGAARAGVLDTDHGTVPTPAFMPVGTQATVKGLDADEIERTGAKMLIMNTYHLLLRPGAEVVAEQGGLHGFSRIALPIATDSGGFQAFSLSPRVRVGEDGFEFSSHLDGARFLLSPEEAMRVQGLLGSDIAMQLDVCPPAGAPRGDVLLAVERTTRWAERCLAARNPNQALFGIVQGGTDVELRRAHAETLARLPLDGLALGGLSVGEPNAEMHRTLAAVVPGLDPARPHYVMGVGTPSDLLRAIGVGVDLFDCVLPTRNARNGMAFVTSGRVVVKNSEHKSSKEPLEDGCPCTACKKGYSRAYLRHLYLAHEMLAGKLMTEHNLTFYGRLVAEARRAVLRGEYSAWAEARLAAFEPSSFEDEPAG